MLLKDLISDIYYTSEDAILFFDLFDVIREKCNDVDVNKI